jgi:hypothetical protein
MNVRMSLMVSLYVCVVATSASAQTPPKEPPPLWDVNLGAAFVGTGGNTDTTTIGADFGMHRRWPVWQIEAMATAIRTTDKGTQTAERYSAHFAGSASSRQSSGSQGASAPNAIGWPAWRFGRLRTAA